MNASDYLKRSALYAFLQHQRLHQAKREKNQEARPA